MRRALAILLSMVLAMLFAACGAPKRQVPPNYDQVRENSEQGSQDLRQEEDKKKQSEEEE